MIIRNIPIFYPSIKGYQIINGTESLIEILKGSPIIENIDNVDTVIGMVSDNDSIKLDGDHFVGDVIIDNKRSLNKNEVFKPKSEVRGNVVMENDKFGFRIDSIIIYVDRVLND